MNTSNNILNREKAITRTSVIGITTNIFLVAFKAGVGLLAGAIAIVLDAVNNLTDALSSIITIIGIKLAKKHPDNKHPFGYGRIEYFSTILISLMILGAGVTSIIESVKKIINPTIPDYKAVTIIIIVVSVITKLMLGRYVSHQGKKYNSDALQASGADASFDAIISVATLVGAIVTLIFDISVDGYIGAIISVFIIKAGIEMLLSAISDVLGNRPDSEISQNIKKTIAGFNGVNGAFDLILHNYGPDKAIGSVHVEIDGEMSAVEIHKLTKQIQKKIMEQFHIFLTVGIYAVDHQDIEKVSIRENINGLCKSKSGVINTHGYYIDLEEKIISFDVGIDFTISEHSVFNNELTQMIENEYPGFRVIINLDTYYSD